MKGLSKSLLLVVPLGVFAWWGFLSSAQRNSATQSVGQVADLPLYLNGEPVGSAANTKPLVARLRALEGKLDQNANLPSGALPNIGRMVVVPGETMSLHALGQVWDSFHDFFSYPQFKRLAIWNPGSCGEDKAPAAAFDGPKFVLATAVIPPDELKRIAGTEQCWLYGDVYTTEGRSRYYTRFVKSYRVVYTSLEVTASGSYLLNEQARDARHRVSPIANLGNPSFARRIDAAPVKQRQIDAAALQKEVETWVDRRVAEGSDELYMDDDATVVLPIVVSGRASFASLAPILRSIRKPNLKVTLIIN